MRLATSRHAKLSTALCLVAVLALVGCGGGGNGGAGGGGGGAQPAGPLPGFTGTYPDLTEPFLTRNQDLPGLNVTIVSVTDSLGNAGPFQVGDYLSVIFRVQNDAGMDIPVWELNSASIYLSGPTMNYQPVLDRQSDISSFSIDNGDGTWTYNFQDPIPANYLPGFNDTPDIGFVDGDWSGTPLVDGTYTVGIEMYKYYDIEGERTRDPSFGSMDLLFGNAMVLEPREVSTTEHCNACHVELRFHGGFRRELLQCLLCHTAGAEDTNDPAVLNGTPGVTVDLGPLVHRIHMGSKMPSLLGIQTDNNGSRTYGNPSKPNAITRNFRGTTNIYDYSNIIFPAWPSLSEPTAKDAGYSMLSSAAQDAEDEVRMGTINCDSCHGDPDGAGPIEAPAQGDFAYSNPTRMDCGSCHDDWDFDKPYSANLTTMPPQPDNDTCIICHPATGPSALPTKELHIHPMNDENVMPDAELVITSLDEAGTNDGSGTFEPGEKIQITFEIREKATGNPVSPTTLNRMEFAVHGPLSNSHILTTDRPPLGALGAGPVFVMNAPQQYPYEFVGDSTGALGDVFTTLNAPHWTPAGASTTVRVRTGFGAATTIPNGVPAIQNYIDVADSTGFARGNIVVIDDGLMTEEYLEVSFVDGNRIWFYSPYQRGEKASTVFDHAMGASVAVVTTNTLTENTDYTLDSNTGAITEMIEFGAGTAVIVSYTSDFVVPARYPVSLNDSPDLDETIGKWGGKSLVDGTYTVALWARQNISVSAYGETTSYNRPTNPGTMNFQVGVGSPVMTNNLISSPQNCYNCHQDIYFHGNGRRGYESCIACHGTTGGEDRAQFVSGSSSVEPSPEVKVNFREMLHRIHMGEELDDPTNYKIVGFGNNVHTYEHVIFPSFKGGLKDCVACHGNDEWQMPRDHNHPTEQGQMSLDWTVTCGSCHNSPAAGAHMALQMNGSVEACAVCHGQGAGENVELIHKSR